MQLPTVPVRYGKSDRNRQHPRTDIQGVSILRRGFMCLNLELNSLFVWCLHLSSLETQDLDCTIGERCTSRIAAHRLNPTRNALGIRIIDGASKV